MNFLHPLFLFGALAIAVPVVLHLLRRDVAPEVPFTAVRLMRTSPVERSRRRRLRDLLLLAARVAALLLVAAAFARPFAPGAVSAMLPLRVIALDRSFSMAAPGRFERATELARAAIEEASFDERVAVIGFDDRASVVAPPGTPSEARAALDALAPGSGGTRYAAVLAKASELAGGGAARLIIVSDLQRAGWDGGSPSRIPASLQVETRDVGVPPPNIAVTSARVDEGGVVASVHNASPQARAGTITIRQNGRDAARGRYSVAANATTEVPIAFTPAAGGAEVGIDDPDGYPADNTRYLVIGAASLPEVLVVTSGNAPGFYLERALRAGEDGEAIALRPQLVGAAELDGARAANLSGYRALVLLATRSLDRQARDRIAAFVRGGGGLMIAASADVEPAVVASLFGWRAPAVAMGESRHASLTATDVRHPIFRPFGAFAANLGNVRFTRAWRIDPTGWRVAARFDDGTPALVERSEGTGRILLFASDLDRRWNDFPLAPSFVPFVTEAVRHVAARAVEPDQFVVGRVPGGTKSEPGIHRLDSGRVVAVNVDPRESDTGRMTPRQFAAMLEPVESAAASRAAGHEQTEARQSLWQYGLMLMLVALVAESFVGRA